MFERGKYNSGNPHLNGISLVVRMAGNWKGNLVKEESHRGWKLQNLNICSPYVFDIVLNWVEVSSNSKAERLKELKI